MPKFDMILGMDFLRKYGAEIDYKKKKVKFNLDSGDKFTFSENWVLSLMISNVKALKMLSKGYVGYLVYVSNKAEAKVASSMDSVPVVCEFLNVFLNNLSRLALEREVEFSIKMALGIALISKIPYQMAPIELYELKK